MILWRFGKYLLLFANKWLVNFIIVQKRGLNRYTQIITSEDSEYYYHNQTNLFSFNLNS